MSIRWTSRLGLAGEINRLEGLRLEVYSAIKAWTGETGPTREQLAQHLGRKESSICGRVNELIKLGFVARGPITRNATGMPAETLIALAYRAEQPTPAPRCTSTGQGELFPDLNRPRYL